MNEDNIDYLNIYDNDYKIEKQSKSDSLYIAKKYFDIYYYLKTREDIKNANDPVEYLKNLNRSYYMVNGRYLTDEEIIAYEISNIKTFLISNQYDKLLYKNKILKLYNFLVKIKLTFKKEKVDEYRSYINIIYCLLDMIPPFLDEVYEKCENVEKRKNKVIVK